MIRCGKTLVYAGALLLLATGCTWVRIVRVTPQERFDDALSRAELAEERGDPWGARAGYDEALEWFPEHPRAWEGRLRVLPREDVAAVRAELYAWQQRMPASAYPHWLEGRLDARLGSAGDEAAGGSFARAWRLEPTPQSPLLDPARMDLRNAREWAAYVTLLRALEPSTPALERRWRWSLVELGREPEAAAGLTAESGPELTGLIRAALRLHERRPEEAETSLEAADPRWAETGFLKVRLHFERGALARASKALRRLRSTSHPGRGAGPTEIDVLSAIEAIHTGSQVRGREILREVTPRIQSPALRVEASLLYHVGTPPGDSFAERMLREAIPWVSVPADHERLLVAFLSRGLVADAVTVAEAKLALLSGLPGLSSVSAQAADEESLHRARMDAEALQVLLSQSKTWVREWWSFWLRTPRAGERKKRLQETEEVAVGPVLALMLVHPRSEYRVQALVELRQRPVVSAADVPTAIAVDPDPRVRAAWIVFAAQEGGALAQAAILAGRQDPDPYVREVAGRQTLPDDR